VKLKRRLHDVGADVRPGLFGGIFASYQQSRVAQARKEDGSGLIKLGELSPCVSDRRPWEETQPEVRGGYRCE
jgi:hypothetical protein